MENIFVEFLPPWVETGLQPAFYDKESGTVLQQTARMYARVNMLIRMFNKLSKQTKETVENYINQFNELHDYVHDYFDNLDVQEEINNKLDAMADSGELADIIAQYLTLAGVLAYSTVEDLSNATNVASGSKCKTYGYKRINDGVYDLYTIRETTEGDVVDGYNIVEINNTENLVGERLQSGEESVIELISTDDIQEYLDLDRHKTIVLTEDYTATSKIFINSNTTLDLNSHTLTCDYDSSETILFAYKLDDTFTAYNGNRNITIKNGTIESGCLALMHNANVILKNVEFTNTNSPHCIQIASCYNVTVDSCIFNGGKATNINSDECINIDPCNYSAQPWMDPSSVMYDHTPNRNIVIENNTFNNGTSTFRYNCACGSHGADDSQQIYAIGVTIRNNHFGSPYTSFIHSAYWQNVIITNNTGEIDSTIGNTPTYGIRFRGSAINVNINNNEFLNSMSVIYFGGDSNVTKNNITIANNRFSTLDTTTYQAFRITDVKNCVIKNNVLNYKQNLIYTNSVSGVDSTYCDNIKIINNYINKTDSTSNSALRIKDTNNIVVDGNNFAYDSLSSPAGYAIAITYNEDLHDITISNNKTKFPRNFMTTESYQSYVDCRNNEVLYSISTTFSSDDHSGSGSFYKPLTHFSSLLLQLGETYAVQSVVLRPWLNQDKFDTTTRKYKIPIATANGTLGVIEFIVDNDATTFSFSGDLAVRYIFARD